MSTPPYVPSCLLPHMSPHVYYPYVPSCLLPLCPLMSTTPSPLMSTTTCVVSCPLPPMCSFPHVYNPLSPLMSPHVYYPPSPLMSTTPQVPSCLLTPKYPHVYYPLCLPVSFVLHFRGMPGPPPHLSPLPCRFVVELCDMVSVQTLEIACLELFSSVPESFNVYSAERWVWQACFVLGVISDQNCPSFVGPLLQPHPLSRPHPLSARPCSPTH